MRYFELLSDLGFVLFILSIAAAALLRVRQTRRGVKMPSGRIWWITPVVLTAGICVLSIYYSLLDEGSWRAWGKR